MLLVRQRREAASIPLGSQVQGLGPQRRRLWKEIGEACGWKRPRAPSVGYMFADEGDPNLPRDTKVGYVARTAPPEEEGGRSWNS